MTTMLLPVGPTFEAPQGDHPSRTVAASTLRFEGYLRFHFVPWGVSSRMIPRAARSFLI